MGRVRRTCGGFIRILIAKWGTAGSKGATRTSLLSGYMYVCTIYTRAKVDYSERHVPKMRHSVGPASQTLAQHCADIGPTRSVTSDTSNLYTC